MWHMALMDAKQRPMTGWGLDSYRNYTKQKPYIYIKDPHMDISEDKKSRRLTAGFWDNPHSLLISLFFEWGIFGIIILGGYIRFCAIRFMRAIKDPNTLALTTVGLMVLIVSLGHFPMFLSRFCVIIIPLAAMYEIQTGGD